MSRKLEESPPEGFASRGLVIAELASGVWRRIYESRFSDPLGFGFGPSRFSDWKTTVEPPERYGVVYLGSSVKVCFAEVILRDRGVRRIKAFPLEWAELDKWTCAELQVSTALRLVDLRGDGLLRMGVPTDVVRANSQTLAALGTSLLGPQCETRRNYLRISTERRSQYRAVR